MSCSGTAARSTGLSDFGPENWREPYERLVTAIEAEARLHTLGRLMTRAALLRALRTRLLMTRVLDEHPEILDESVQAPIVISGPSRSGTTITFELLAQDPELRAPLAWEGLHPLPLPETPDGVPDPRPRIAESEQDFWEDVQPEFAAIHELRAMLPVECITFMAADFHHAQWSTELDIPSFSGWAALQDPTPHYEFHKRILQILQWQGPHRRWLLKSPGHLGSLPSFFSVYPDGCVVHTHRDPVKTIPSTVNTTITSRWLRTDEVREEELCQGVALGFQFMLAGVAEGTCERDASRRSLRRRPLPGPDARSRRRHRGMLCPGRDGGLGRTRQPDPGLPRGEAPRQARRPPVRAPRTSASPPPACASSSSPTPIATQSNWRPSRLRKNPVRVRQSVGTRMMRG